MGKLQRYLLDLASKILHLQNSENTSYFFVSLSDTMVFHSQDFYVLMSCRFQCCSWNPFLLCTFLISRMLDSLGMWFWTSVLPWPVGGLRHEPCWRQRNWFSFQCGHLFLRSETRRKLYNESKNLNNVTRPLRAKEGISLVMPFKRLKWHFFNVIHQITIQTVSNSGPTTYSIVQCLKNVPP